MTKRRLKYREIFAKNSYWEPMKATSNQNAKPCTVPDCDMVKERGTLISWRSVSWDVEKSTMCLTGLAIQIRMSKVSCTYKYSEHEMRITLLLGSSKHISFKI